MFESLFADFDTDSFFDQFRLLENQVDQLFGSSPWQAGIRAAQRGAYPPMNVGATPERFDIYVFAAKLDPKRIDLSIQQNLLTVSGSRKAEVNEKAQYYRQERFDGDFKRVLTLPEDADPERVTAKYSDGVLHITVERREAARPRQITVN